MKRGSYVIIILVGMLICMPFANAGIIDWFKKITGEAVDAPVDINITLGSGNSPVINTVYAPGATVPNLGPSNTNLSFNFSVSDADGADNLNDNSIRFNVTNSGVDRLNNTACTELASSGNNANYTCNVTVWWFDTDGAWNIIVNISDNHGNQATNTTQTVTLNTLTGFVSGPGNLTWTTLQPGTTNETPTNWLKLNNTGNQDVPSGNVSINATNLVGETTPAQAIYAENFSVGTTTSGTNPECDSNGATSTNMTVSTYTNVTNSVINAGNYSVNNNVTGQETLFFCIREIGIELSEQAYSTASEGTWTLKIAT